MIPALVLAGRANTGRLRGWSDAASEAMVPIAGRPMVARVLEALRGSGSVGDLIVVTADPDAVALVTAMGGRAVAAGESLVENVRAGLEALPPGQDEALVVTGDAALLTPAAVDEFVARSRETGADLCWAIVPREAYLRELPGSRRTFVRLADGHFTGGNVFYLRRRAVEPALALLADFYAARKRPLRLARLLGVGILARLLVGRLRVAAVERRVRELAGIAGRAVVMERAEVGFDVDEPEDAAYAERVLRDRGGGAGGAA